MWGQGRAGEMGSEAPRAPWPGRPPSGDREFGVTDEEGCKPHCHLKVTAPALRLRVSYASAVQHGTGAAGLGHLTLQWGPTRGLRWQFSDQAPKVLPLSQEPTAPQTQNRPYVHTLIPRMRPGPSSPSPLGAQKPLLFAGAGLGLMSGVSPHYTMWLLSHHHVSARGTFSDTGREQG